MIRERQDVEPGLLDRDREIAELHAAGHGGGETESDGTRTMRFGGQERSDLGMWVVGQERSDQGDALRRAGAKRPGDVGPRAPLGR